LEDHLRPLNTHLGKLNELIAETEAYVGVSVQTLETSREQNIALNQEISEALRLMTLAKNDLANEMLDIRDYLEKIGDSTNRLARLYQGEDRSLSLHISNLANQISVFSDRLNASITESASALEQAAEMTKKQEEYGTGLLAHLDRQVQQLSEINRTIQDNTTHFTTESAQFVHQTLSEYDAGLGEVIERLSFVVAEIRDAIDGLPVALRLRGEGTQNR
jgi:methyl-accepting chemotaxis protein